MDEWASQATPSGHRAVRAFKFNPRQYISHPAAETMSLQSPLFSAKEPARKAAARKVRLSEADAIDVWIARWMRVRRKDILARYGCDSRRLYEVWTGEKHPAAKDKARRRFLAEYPELADRVDFGDHRTIPRGPDPERQLVLFDASDR